MPELPGSSSSSAPMVGAPPPPPAGITPLDVDDIAASRELFWHNVMREMLTSLSVLRLSGRRPRPADGTASPDPAQLFDGRLAILTKTGERIPIADVFPLFACGINTDDAYRSLSVAVECTVFQIRTPDGQVFTLPLHEIRGFHALSPELMKQLEDLARAESGGSEEERLKRPFGFAAYTPAARSPDPYYPQPSESTGKKK